MKIYYINIQSKKDLITIESFHPGVTYVCGDKLRDEQFSFLHQYVSYDKTANAFFHGRMEYFNPKQVDKIVDFKKLNLNQIELVNI